MGILSKLSRILATSGLGKGPWRARLRSVREKAFAQPTPGHGVQGGTQESISAWKLRAVGMAKAGLQRWQGQGTPERREGAVGRRPGPGAGPQEATGCPKALSISETSKTKFLDLPGAGANDGAVADGARKPGLGPYLPVHRPPTTLTQPLVPQLRASPPSQKRPTITPHQPGACLVCSEPGSFWTITRKAPHAHPTEEAADPSGPPTGPWEGGNVLWELPL